VTSFDASMEERRAVERINVSRGIVALVVVAVTEECRIAASIDETRGGLGRSSRRRAESPWISVKPAGQRYTRR